MKTILTTGLAAAVMATLGESERLLDVPVRSRPARKADRAPDRPHPTKGWRGVPAKYFVKGTNRRAKLRKAL